MKGAREGPPRKTGVDVLEGSSDRRRSPLPAPQLLLLFILSILYIHVQYHVENRFNATWPLFPKGHEEELKEIHPYSCPFVVRLYWRPPVALSNDPPVVGGRGGTHLDRLRPRRPHGRDIPSRSPVGGRPAGAAGGGLLPEHGQGLDRCRNRGGFNPRQARSLLNCPGPGSARPGGLCRP